MKKKFLLILILLFFNQLIKSQIVPPYQQNFDSASCTGWSHYALSGTDDWERGMSSGTYLNTVLSAPYVWGTKLNGNTSYYSVMALETPDFDLSDTTKTFLLGFAHEYAASGSDGGNVQYSTDLGITWIVLNGAAGEKQNWYTSLSSSSLGGQPSWSSSDYYSYVFSAHSLAFLQGQSHVRFRFQYASTSTPNDGWQIDNFAIVQNAPDVVALIGQTINAAKHFSTYNVASTLLYNGLSPPPFSNTTNYYFSRDSILDIGDSLIGTKTQTISGTINPWSKTFTMIPNLHAGNYYIFYTHDFANNLMESYETNNTSYCILHVDSTFTIPEYKEDFEGNIDYWKKNVLYESWTKGYSNVHQIENPHSGTNSWYIQDAANEIGMGPVKYLEGPYLDLTPAPDNVMCFWYKMKRTYPSSPLTQLEYSRTNTLPSYLSSVYVPITRANGWDCHCESLTYLNGADNAKIRFKFTGAGTYGFYAQNINVDDIYIGQPKADLSIENRNDLYTPQSFVSDTLTYSLFNSGMVPAATSVSQFYWSADSILDASDVLIATVNESPLNDTLFRKEKVMYAKPTTVAGNYFIIYKLDVTNVITEMREENNIGFFRLNQVPVITVPYFNDFETQIDNWSHRSTIGNDDWRWGTPSGTYFDSAFSGVKAFHTTASDSLSDMTRQHLYTPVFDLTTLTHPVMEFDMDMDGPGTCGCSHSRMNMSYSIDGGANWIILDTVNNSYNRWYYPMDFSSVTGKDLVYYMPNYSELMFDGTEKVFAETNQYNSRDIDRNTHYVTDLTFLAGQHSIQFRYNLASQLSTPPLSGIPSQGAVIDNFRIEDKYIDLLVEYKKSLMISSLNKKVKFWMNIKNKGNYISNPAYVKFYVSADTLLDGSDFYLGQDSMKAIRPDMKEYLNETFFGPDTLSHYSFLLYQIDPTNTNIELNEINNTGYWPLALDSIKTYPYIQDFSNPILNGWDGYTSVTKDEWRIRTSAVPGQYLYQSNIHQEELYTDMMNSTVSWTYTPTWYVETPSFDFTSVDSVSVQFDLLCDGVMYDNGGNMSFSTNGGNSWTLLTTAYGAATNWYDNPSMYQISNEPGWARFYSYTPVSFDLSFLKGFKNVVFKYKFMSNNAFYGDGGPQGLHIDNFRINGKNEDYVADDSMIAMNVSTFGPPIVNLNYSITNAGNGSGRHSTTKFYWSVNNVFDAGDSLLTSINESPIDSASTFHGTAAITYPTITHPVYYVFYKTDADSVIRESNEHNNVGSFQLTFDPSAVPSISQGGLTAFVNDHQLYVEAHEIGNDNKYTISFINTIGEKLATSDVVLNEGMNQFDLPTNIASGLYLVTLQNEKKRLYWKVVIQQ